MALIYIVEDDENIREIETIALKNSNYMVCAFEKATTFYKAGGYYAGSGAFGCHASGRERV